MVVLQEEGMRQYMPYEVCPFDQYIAIFGRQQKSRKR